MILVRDAGHVIWAHGGNDLVCGSAGHDVVHAGLGADTVLAADGDDDVTGGPGDDDIQGNQGDDDLQGDGGDDTVDGGMGDDDVQDAAAALAEPAGLSIRANTCAMSVHDLERALAGAGVRAERGRVHPDTLIVDHPDKQTTRDVVLTYSDSIRNGWIGRQLPRLFREQRLEVLSIDPLQVFVHYALAELFLEAVGRNGDGAR